MDIKIFKISQLEGMFSLASWIFVAIFEDLSFAHNLHGFRGPIERSQNLGSNLEPLTVHSQHTRPSCRRGRRTLPSLPTPLKPSSFWFQRVAQTSHLLPCSNFYQAAPRSTFIYLRRHISLSQSVGPCFLISSPYFASSARIAASIPLLDRFSPVRLRILPTIYTLYSVFSGHFHTLSLIPYCIGSRQITTSGGSPEERSFAKHFSSRETYVKSVE